MEQKESIKHAFVDCTILVGLRHGPDKTTAMLNIEVLCHQIFDTVLSFVMHMQNGEILTTKQQLNGHFSR